MATLSAEKPYHGFGRADKGQSRKQEDRTGPNPTRVRQGPDPLIRARPTLLNAHEGLAATV